MPKKTLGRTITLPTSSKPVQSPDTHSLRISAQKLPKGCVLLGVLKSVETELRKRDMLSAGTISVSPLWFLAETERNIYLWRNGKSIDDQQDFSFWIDITALISKRREQLKRASVLNPFTNPLWGASQFDNKLVEQERDYLDSFEDLVHSILKHAEALSVASETIRSDLAKSIEPRLPVVLPSQADRRTSQATQGGSFTTPASGVS